MKKVKLGKYMIAEFKQMKIKTEIWKITNSLNGTFLGIIKWNTSFRKYAFYPEANTCFENDCLTHLIDFMKRLELKRINGP